MKRFTKMLALGMAIALTFGMTVSAAEAEAPSKSTTDAIVKVEPGIKQNAITATERQAIKDNADAKAKDLLKAYGVVDVEKSTFRAIEAFDLTVEKAGNVTFAYPEGDGWGKEYGTTWGYSLIHFKKDGAAELIPVKREDKGKYVAFVNSGSPFAVVEWGLNLTRIYGGILTNTNTYATGNPYQIDAEYVSGKLYGGLGNTIAQKYSHKFTGVVQDGWADLYVNKKSNVYINLPNISADEKYIMVSYPYADNGRIRTDIEVPTNYELIADPNNTVDTNGNRVFYAKDVDAGHQLIMIFKTSVDTTPQGGGSTPPVVEAVTPSQGAGQTTAGVVSPKTGEMLPVAVILAAICLAGAAVCAKKARTNA